MERYIVITANNSWGDYPEIDEPLYFDEWLDAVKMVRREGIMIIDTETGDYFEEDDVEVTDARKVFAWYMVD